MLRAAEIPDASILKLVQMYADAWHQGRIPQDRITFLERMLEDFLPPSKKMGSSTEWFIARKYALDLMSAATDVLMRQESEQVN